MQQIPSEVVPDGPACPPDAIRPLVVPQVAPPFDDELASVLASPDEGDDGRRVGATSPPGPPEQQRHPGLAVSPHDAEHAASRHAADGRGGDPGAWPRQFAQVLAETLAGSRSQRQLAPWTTEQVRRRIRELGPLFATGDRPLVRRVMTAAPASGVLELTAVVGFGSRVRVLALRLERERSGRAWCCTAIESA
jgi:hypothetical protein